MFNVTIFSVIIGINIFLLGFFAFGIFRKRHICNFLVGLSIIGLLILEAGKLCLVFDFALYDKILGAGLFLTILFWLAASVSFLPSKPFSFNKVILSPVFGLLFLIFFFIWWIKPFTVAGNLEGSVQLSKVAQYFFVLVVFSLTLVLSNLERALYFLKQKNIKLLFFSALFLLGPYIFLSTYAVLFSTVSTRFLIYSSLTVLAGSLMLIFSRREGFGAEQAKESGSIQTSMILFLIGGYLFFIGAFIKLFEFFGWNLDTLFSFLTTLFIFFVSAFFIFSSSLKGRIKNLLLKHFSSQRYDWQKIWEEFTYKVSLVTDIEKMEVNIKEAISKIMDIRNVQIYVFEKEMPFEGEFCDWLLRRAEAFKIEEVFDKNFCLKFPKAKDFFEKEKSGIISPLYGDRKIIGFIGFSLGKGQFLDKELLKVLSLQASGAILNCWANQALRDVEKKESIYKMSTFVIHDLKNYINNLSLLLSNKDKFDIADFRKDAFFTLETTIDKMKRLMLEFRVLRGDLAVNKRPYNLKRLVDECIDELGKGRLEGVKLNLDIDNSIEVNVDLNNMGKVIYNLVLNALEAMDGKREISISAQNRNNFIELIIKDTGCGMSKDFIENKLFKPFVSTKIRGMGIGLYQCKTIVEAHGGKIAVESEEGAGTAFRVRMPRA